ncbi:MAG: permease [Dehalococcoidaceae bacterium]|nr:permease [Dehalococcoidaceae bacterium]
MSFFLDLLAGGWNGLIEYLSLHVITCLVPAFFIAGAISVFVSQEAILKYFGPKTNKFLSYGVASVSGTILAVCSCTVLPLFAGIYKKGAGLGPAIAFLFSGPAINVLAITYSARLLGFDIGLARAVSAVIFAIVIGLIMAFIYRREKTKGDEQTFANLEVDPETKKLWQQLIYFASLVGILIFASSKNWIGLGIAFVVLGAVLWKWFNKQDIKYWMQETWRFVKLVTPWLLGGVFVAGILKVLIPDSFIAQWVGGNGILANFIASFSAMLMYFATLTEVPIVRAFMDMGMGKGPVLALLLAGPALSLPSIIVLQRIMGWKKTLTYVLLVTIMATLTGVLFGMLIA